MSEKRFELFDKLIQREKERLAIVIIFIENGYYFFFAESKKTE